MWIPDELHINTDYNSLVFQYCQQIYDCTSNRYMTVQVFVERDSRDIWDTDL